MGTARSRTSWPTLLGAGVFVLTVLVYARSLSNGFVNWDDDFNILNNQSFRGLSPKHLKWMFTTFHLGPYQPLSWLTLGLDYTVWGLDPFGYHLTTVLLHASCSAAFFAVALDLLRRSIPHEPETPAWRTPACAAFAALVFSLHPLRVESVAWVSERRDVLSGLFFLLSIHAYLRGLEREGWLRRHAWALSFFVAALLSKAIVVGLPVVLLALDYFPLRRLPTEPRRWLDAGTRMVWVEKIPYLLLSLGAGIVGYLGQVQAGATLPLADWGIVPRLSLTAYSLVFYLGKTIWPAALHPLYQTPHPPLLWHWPYWGAALVVTALTALGIWKRRRWPAAIVLWVFYGVSVGPVAGLVKLGESATADRYTYLACLGWALFAGYLLARALGGRTPFRAAALPLAIGLCALLAGLTWAQIPVWRDSESLWRHVLRHNPGNALAENNLGIALAGQGRLDEAIAHYGVAIRGNPQGAEGHANLGNALAGKRMVPQAIAAFREALERNPEHVQARNNLAVLLADAGELGEAELHFRAALRSRPATAEAHFGLAIVLGKANRVEESLREYAEALRLAPMFAAAHREYGRALLRAGRAQEGAAHIEAARRLESRPAKTR